MKNFIVTLDPEEEWMAQELAQSLLGQDFLIKKIELAVGEHTGRHIRIDIENDTQESRINDFLRGYRAALLKREDHVRAWVEADMYPVTHKVKSGAIWRYEITEG